MRSKSSSQPICCQPYFSAATDTLLWRVGTSCHRLRRLVIEGSEVRSGVSENGSKFPQVTNKGLFWLCGQPCPELRLRGPIRYVGGFFEGSALKSCFPRFAEEIQCGDDGRVSPLCSSLTHLNMLRCLGVELAGLQVVCKSLRSLQNP